MDFFEQIDAVYKAAMLASLIVTGVSTLFFLIMNNRYVSKKTMDEHVRAETLEFEKIKRRLDDGAQEFTKINTRMDNMPTKDQIHNLSNSMTSLSGEIKSVNTGISGLERQLDGLSSTVTSLVNNELGQKP
ncbi:DUF2730 family protein [Terasakiella sp. A23]|uniref:DUF2730 family protein n=1 Tax=Terasakiella sp. FCG-A23 TaxID=3080561 RepID=UPI0029552919|nr:DUF2730 family protein [Terasakiella sp. A23]MDV7340986.1 DUF2730 family protein [Terasakiella sp. A23]